MKGVSSQERTARVAKSNSFFTVLGPMSGPIHGGGVGGSGIDWGWKPPLLSLCFLSSIIMYVISPHVSESDPHAPPVLCGYERELGFEYVWVVGLWMDLVRFKLKAVSWCIKCNCRHMHLMQSFFRPWLFPLHDGSLRIPPFWLRHVSP